MDNVLAIAFGLGLRYIVDAIGNQDFKLTGTLVGLWEGAVTLHFAKKMPESFDPYLAFGVRLFLDFLLTESILRMVLIIVWTALGMVLADIAPELWSGIGGRRIWRRFRRDVRHFSRRLPEMPTFPRARVVRFSPIIEPIEIAETTSVLSPSAVSPTVQQSTVNAPSITTALAVRKRPVPGQFPSSTISETDTDVGSVYGVRTGPALAGVGTSHHRYSVKPRRPSIGTATEESSVTNESDDVNPPSDASSSSTEIVVRAVEVVEVPQVTEEPVRSKGKGKERAVDPIDIPPTQRPFELPPTPSDSNRPHPRRRLSSVPPPLSGMPSIPDFLESGLGSDWEDVKKEDLPSPPPEKAPPTPIRYIPPPAPSTIGDPTPRPSTFDQDLWDTVSNIPTQPFHTGMTPAPRPSRLPVVKPKMPPVLVSATAPSKPVIKKTTAVETKLIFTPLFGANDEWAPESRLPPDTPSVFTKTPAFDFNNMDIGPEDNANMSREVEIGDTDAAPPEITPQDATHTTDVPTVPTVPPEPEPPVPVSGVDPQEQSVLDPAPQQSQPPPEQPQPAESERLIKKREKKERQERLQQQKQQEEQQREEQQREKQLRKQQLWEEKLREQQLREQQKQEEKQRERQQREQQEREQQEREQRERERKEREQQEREQQEREKKLREQQQREQQLREEKLREEKLWEQQQREQQQREQQLQEQQQREKQQREQQEREEKLREQQLQEQQQREQQRQRQRQPQGRDLRRKQSDLASQAQLDQQPNPPPVESQQQQQPLSQPQGQEQVPGPVLEQLEPSVPLTKKRRNKQSARSTPEGSQTPRVPQTPATTILGDFVSQTFDDTLRNKLGVAAENQSQPPLDPSGAGNGNGANTGRDADLLGLNNNENTGGNGAGTRRDVDLLGLNDENANGSNGDTQKEVGKSGWNTPPNTSGKNGGEFGVGAGVEELGNGEDVNAEPEVVQTEGGEGDPSSTSSAYSSTAGVAQDIKERNKQAILIRAQIFELQKALKNMEVEKLKAEMREELDPLLEESPVLAKEIEKAQNTLEKLIKRANKRYQAAVESTQFLTLPKSLNLDKYTPEKAAVRTEDVLGLFFNTDCTKFTLTLNFPKGGASKAYQTSVGKVLNEYGIKPIPRINGMNITLTSKTYQDLVAAYRQKYSKDSGDP